MNRSLCNRLRRAGLALSIAALAAAVGAPTATAAPGWFAGTGAYQTGNQCYGGQVTGWGNNAQGFVSYWTDPAAGYPALGDKYWMRIHVGMVGFSCPWGIGDFATKLRLPEGTSLAVDPASPNPDDKVRCFFVGSDGAQQDVTDKTWTYPANTSIKGDWCKSTQVPAATADGYDLGYRMLAQGTQFWINVPVRSTKRLAGMAGAGDTTKAIGNLTSGVNSPAAPYQWVTVFDRPTTIGYPADALPALGDTTATTRGVLTNWWRKGKAYVDLGTVASGTYDVSAGPIAIDGAHAEYTITQSWTQLAPGTDHRWRLRFVDEQGVTTVGEPRTFRTTGATAPPQGPIQPAPPAQPTPPAAPTQPSQPTQPAKPDAPAPTSPAGGAVAPGGTTAPVASGNGGPAATPRDATPAGPSFTLARGARLKALASRRGVSVDVLCAAACTPRATLRVDARTARRLGLGRRAVAIAAGRANAAGAGTVRVTLRATGKAAARLRRAGQVRATLTVALGPGATRSSVVTLRR